MCVRVCGFVFGKECAISVNGVNTDLAYQYRLVRNGIQKKAMIDEGCQMLVCVLNESLPEYLCCCKKPQSDVCAAGRLFY